MKPTTLRLAIAALAHRMNFSCNPNLHESLLPAEGSETREMRSSVGAWHQSKIKHPRSMRSINLAELLRNLSAIALVHSKVAFRFLAVAVAAGIPHLANAQGTFLTDPSDLSKQAVFVAPGGRVGLGTLTPATLLDIVNGEVGILGRSSAFHIGQITNGGLYFTSFNDQDSMISSGAECVTLDWLARSTSASMLNLEDGEASLLTDDGLTPGSAFAPTRRLTVKPDGRVGINTQAPAARLHCVADDSVLSLETSGAFHAATVLDLRRAGVLKWAFNLSGVNESGNNDSLALYSYATGRNVLYIDRDNGNVGLGVDGPQAKLDVAGKINCTVLELTSDRNQKQDFAAVDSRSVLDRLLSLSIQTWAYTNDANARHIGPMAQDWKAAFPELGSDDRHIGAGDLGSVALAAIQGLDARFVETLKAKDTEIAALKQELRALRAEQATFAARFERFEKLMARTVPPTETTAKSSSDDASSSADSATAR